MKGVDLQKSLKKGMIIIFAALFAFFIGALALWKYEPDGFSLSQVWADADKAMLMLALLLISLSMPFVAMRWRALFPKEKKKEAGPGLLTGILCAAFVFNIALPGPVGELISAGMVRKKCGIPFFQGMAALAVSRIIGLGSACAIAGLIFWVSPFDVPSNWGTVLSVTALVLLFGSFCLIFLIIRPQFFEGILQKFAPGPKSGKLRTTLHNTVDGILKGLSETVGRGQAAYLESICWALIGHVLVASGIYVAALSIGVTVSWSAILFTYAASIAASVAMFMLPASSAAWDVLFATSLKVSAEISWVEAISITGVVRIQQLMVALLGVCIVWWFARDLLELDESELEKT